ncbi:WG repeat-containing protein [Leeia aquatica]|uniref:WG repeat-containing protein n=1 Tax=Leeia aquatica TaxID=2725557 RepID=A0A847S9R7_9NEIS|nr:WG repeat-containing protein [Leeia aquatica]NLR74306.1 WG repeat-containing protein [Leeia aquatica]
MTLLRYLLSALPSRAHALLLTLLGMLSLAAQAEVELVPHCGGAFGLCGYVDKDSRVERIPQQFEDAQRFSNGLAAVRIQGRYGYIDHTGKVVIPPAYQDAGPFLGPYAEVRALQASGIIDRQGRWVVPAQFGRIIPFTGEVFFAAPVSVWSRKHQQFEDNFMASSRPSWLAGRYDVHKSGLFGSDEMGLYHLHRGWLTEPNVRFTRFDRAERGLVWAGTRNSKWDLRWGLMSMDGSWQVAPRFHRVQGLVGTRAVVEGEPEQGATAPGGAHLLSREGAVDPDGKLVVPMAFEWLTFRGGRYGVAHQGRINDHNGSRWQQEALVTEDGQLLGGRYFDEVDEAGYDALPRVRVGATWFSIRNAGELIADQKEGKPIEACPGGISILYHSDGDEFLKPGGQSLGRFPGDWSGRCPGPFRVTREGNAWLLLEDGSWLDPKAPQREYRAVEVNGKWGIADLHGRFTVRPQFDQLQWSAEEALFAYRDKGQSGWINAYGKYQPDPHHNPFVARARSLACPGGLRYVEKAGLWGLQDGQGKMIIEPRYRALSCFIQGVSWTVAPGDTAWCPLGPEGKRREAMPCTKIFYPMELSESYPEVFSTDTFENSVLWTRAWLDYHAGHREQAPRWLTGLWMLPTQTLGVESQ